MLWGVVTLRNKRFGKYRLYILNGRQEFLHIIHTLHFQLPAINNARSCNSPYKTIHGVLTLRYKRYQRVDQQSRISPRKQSQIWTAFWYLVRGLGRAHSEKIWGKKSRWTVPSCLFYILFFGSTVSSILVLREPWPYTHSAPRGTDRARLREEDLVSTSPIRF
jgi:hypothetical protein